MDRDFEFIVAEISKNWRRNAELPASSTQIIAGMFEDVIEHNRQRGYLLHSFQLHRLLTSLDEMNETIIAVFRRATP